jgi:hypothetical protein
VEHVPPGGGRLNGGRAWLIQVAGIYHGARGAERDVGRADNQRTTTRGRRNAVSVGKPHANSMAADAGVDDHAEGLVIE